MQLLPHLPYVMSSYQACALCHTSGHRWEVWQACKWFDNSVSSLKWVGGMGGTHTKTLGWGGGGGSVSPATPGDRVTTRTRMQLAVHEASATSSVTKQVQSLHVALHSFAGLRSARFNYSTCPAGRRTRGAASCDAQVSYSQPPKHTQLGRTTQIMLQIERALQSGAR